MSLINLLLFLIVGFSTTSFAQEGESVTATEEVSYPQYSQWALNVATMNWDENFRVSQGGQDSTQTANFNGLALSVLKEFHISRWGYSVGLSAGTGQANGGSNSSGYRQSKVSFSLLGISPRVFYHFGDKVSGGFTALIFSRTISWPETTGQTVDAGSNIQSSMMADLNIRLFEHWDYYQAVGTLREGATLWKLGVSYRF